MILIARLGKVCVSAAGKAAGTMVSASARPAILALRNSLKVLLPDNSFDVRAGARA
jgi:hypothetical protein